jgi:cytidine deaminase
VTEFEKIAIVAGKDEMQEYTSPCGVCRQVMMEFCRPEEFRIIMAKTPEDYKEMTLKEILPMGFGPKNLAD